MLFGRQAYRDDVQRFSIAVDAGGKLLGAELWLPRNPVGIVIFANGGAPHRFEHAYQIVAGGLNDGGYATVLVDLATPREVGVAERGGSPLIGMWMLTSRLIAVVDHLLDEQRGPIGSLPIGIFGLESGSAAALVTAARRPRAIQALVCHGAAVEKAGVELAVVEAPTLLLAASADPWSIASCHDAISHMRCLVQIMLLTGGGHDFIDMPRRHEIVRAARAWFDAHLAPAADDRIPTVWGTRR
jgi:alpha-beta hydrolase superfamily lysophospholipase